MKAVHYVEVTHYVEVVDYVELVDYAEVVDYVKVVDPVGFFHLLYVVKGKGKSVPGQRVPGS